jgi:hypothetical protein
MPIYIRHLPGTASKIIDEKIIPQNNVFFNPSVAWPILYIRRNEHFKTKEINSIFLYNLENRKNYVINSPMHILQKNCNLFTGIEDLRICWFKDNLWFSGTCTHVSPNMTSELVIGYFNKDLNAIERFSHVDIGSIPVKNVCPFVANGELLLFDIYKSAIYTCTDVYEPVDPANANANAKPKWKKFAATKIKSLIAAPGLSIDGFRGSTSPVHLHGNTYGVIVHDIIFNDQATLITRLSYLHIWMEFDVTTGVVSFVSTPFWLANWGIEYVSGFMIKNEVVTIYLGVNDQTAASFTTTIQDLRVGK